MQEESKIKQVNIDKNTIEDFIPSNIECLRIENSSLRLDLHVPKILISCFRF
jgi:hypothetical protein